MCPSNTSNGACLAEIRTRQNILSKSYMGRVGFKVFLAQWVGSGWVRWTAFDWAKLIYATKFTFSEFQPLKMIWHCTLSRLIGNQCNWCRNGETCSSWQLSSLLSAEFCALQWLSYYSYYLRQGGYVLPNFVCLSVCQQNNSKSYERIFLKFRRYVGNGTNYQWFNFGGDSEGILDSGSLWNFRYHCFQWGIRKTAAKPKMVLPSSEQHCLGGGVQALTAF